MIGAERQREKRATADSKRASSGSSRRSRRNSPASTATSTMPCAARRPGARRRTCCCLRARRRLHHRPHADRRAARAGQAGPQADRRAGRSCPAHASIGPMEGAKLHRRWQSQRAPRSVHGRHGGQEAQPRASRRSSTGWSRPASRKCLPSLRLLASCSPSSMPSFVTTAPGRAPSWPPPSHPLGAAARSPRPKGATERRRRGDGGPSSW